MSHRDPIPAIAETEGTGDTAVLFAELRTALGVPFVNLIWRHLATIPGGLAWPGRCCVRCTPCLPSMTQPRNCAAGSSCRACRWMVSSMTPLASMPKQGR